ncbi:hypothetical protein M422DRAFT_786087 [Sphaerobolus stellatus SS14]|uniref:Uncharacterized protein n=1 Tax=Sphaerobolus stellatus (strain SS14) TaxID=990650 RepID=A0A0C9UDY2_SPHS4|nr:hypothetical protein M422DRAFT_786087 [Sphaerobolus stellatus SS14]
MPPWIIKLYLHTLTITVDNGPTPRNDLVEHITYIPTKDERPTLFRTHLDSTSSKYRPALLQLHQDIPPGALTLLSSNSSSTSAAVTRMYSSNLLMDLPTPDFSMPYNVIMMTCIVLWQSV